MEQMKRYTERPTDINTRLYRNCQFTESTAQFLYCKHETVSHRPPPLPAQAEASPQTAWRAASETRPWELLSFLENRKLQMVVIHFDSKCLLKWFTVGDGGGAGIKKGQDLPVELLNSFLVLFPLFYKNKINLEKLIKLSVQTPQYIVGK